jgi:hypothetical protein
MYWGATTVQFSYLTPFSPPTLPCRLQSPDLNHENGTTPPPPTFIRTALEPGAIGHCLPAGPVEPPSPSGPPPFAAGHRPPASSSSGSLMSSPSPAQPRRCSAPRRPPYRRPGPNVARPAPPSPAALATAEVKFL